jgi:hypothetical protein
METQDSGRDLVVDYAGLAFNFLDLCVVPKSFDKVFYHPNFEHRIKWREGISNELKEKFDKKVYEAMKSRSCGRTYITRKWIFKMRVTEFIASG